MNGFDNQQYAMPPAPGRQIPWKMIIAIIIVIIVAVSIVLGVIYFRGRSTVSVLTQQQLENINNQSEQIVSLCDSADDPESCKRQEILSFAKKVDAIEPCLELGEGYDDCVWLVAHEKSDVTLCQNIVGEEKATSCNDVIYRKLAEQDNNVSICENIINEEKKFICKEVVDPVTAENCLDRGLEEQYCSSLSIIEQAKQKQDKDICLSIENIEQQRLCSDLVSVTDRDFDGLDAGMEEFYGTDDRNSDTDADGLSDYDEIEVYKTDPLNPDTDGDSYLDGQEVSGGFNPKGEG